MTVSFPSMPLVPRCSCRKAGCSVKYHPENVAIVIPARMGSGRLPGKPLREYRGKPLIQWTWEAAEAAKRAQRKLIATDSRRLLDWCERHSPLSCYASWAAEDCPTGSDRSACLVHQANDVWGWDVKTVVNLQCDEPDITGEDLDRLIEAMQVHHLPMVTFAFRPPATMDLRDPNVVKVITDCNDNAIYFSRLPLPEAMVHVGVYAYRISELRCFANLPRGKYELAEDLEQLRMVEAGVPIRVLDLGRPVVSINMEADLKVVGCNKK